jgi:hypothetical protein
MVKLIQMSAASVLVPCVTAHSATADLLKSSIPRSRQLLAYDTHNGHSIVV